MSLVRNPSKYGVSSSHADEDTLPTATQTSFFQKGREFESRYVNHHYTEEERQKLGTFESVDYLPPHSAVYKVRCNFRVLFSFNLFLFFFSPWMYQAEGDPAMINYGNGNTSKWSLRTSSYVRLVSSI